MPVTYLIQGRGTPGLVTAHIGNSLTGTAKKPTSIALLEEMDDVANVAAPGFTDPAS